MEITGKEYFNKKKAIDALKALKKLKSERAALQIARFLSSFKKQEKVMNDAIDLIQAPYRDETYTIPKSKIAIANAKTNALLEEFVFDLGKDLNFSYSKIVKKWDIDQETLADLIDLHIVELPEEEEEDDEDNAEDEPSDED
jgi:hypothetical protein